VWGRSQRAAILENGNGVRYLAERSRKDRKLQTWAIIIHACITASACRRARAIENFETAAARFFASHRCTCLSLEMDSVIWFCLCAVALRDTYDEINWWGASIASPCRCRLICADMMIAPRSWMIITWRNSQINKASEKDRIYAIDDRVKRPSI
jgi:hypothetical protein